MKLLWPRHIALGVIAAASLYASVRNLISTRELGSLSEDPVAHWEERFRPLKEKLPFVRGIVGYISESDVPGAQFDAANDEGEYILTQYALAPVILKRGTEQEWNVANLSSQAFDLWRGAHPSGFEITSFKGGLYLVHRTGG